MKKLFKENTAEIIHFSQLNNQHEPYASCFPTSMAMALRNNGFKWDDKIPLDDYLYELAATPKYKDLGHKMYPNQPLNSKWHQFPALMCQIANDLIKVQSLPINAKQVPFDMNIVRQCIDAGKMIVCGTYLTDYGHLVCISGYTDNTVILNDPYGNVNDLYHFKDSNKFDDGFLVELNPKLLSKLRYKIIFDPIHA